MIPSISAARARPLFWFSPSNLNFINIYSRQLHRAVRSRQNFKAVLNVLCSNFLNDQQKISTVSDSGGILSPSHRQLHSNYLSLQKMSLNKSTSQSLNDKIVDEKECEPPTSKKQSALKQTFRDYGATVIAFHACLSLFSFGLSYIVVSSGLDVVSWLDWVGVGKSLTESRFAAGAGNVVVAYAIYKVFSPLRVACTITVTPFIVRYLRRRGFIKTPISSQKK